MIVVMDREAGNIIEEVSSLEEGYALIEQYEAQDQEKNAQPVIPAMSFAAEPEEPSEQVIQWEGDSDFAQEVSGRAVSHIMPIMDELMQTVQVLQPRLYDAVMRKLKDN